MADEVDDAAVVLVAGAVAAGSLVAEADLEPALRKA